MLAAGRTVPIRTKPLKLWRLRGRAAVSLRIANVVRPFSALCDGLF
jgi:hypothetical protein